MAYWKNRGLRGSLLEIAINMTNEKYRQNKLALIQKIPTPIKPIEIDKSTRHITLAYFEKKSTVDYIGTVQGIPVCFDAKECATESFSLQNIHEHQFQFMKEFEEQGGVAFVLIYYTSKDVYYYLRFEKLKEFMDRAKTGKKSFNYSEIELEFQISTHDGVFVHYLEMINQDIKLR